MQPQPILATRVSAEACNREEHAAGASRREQIQQQDMHEQLATIHPTPASNDQQLVRDIKARGRQHMFMTNVL